jgi:V/A-type H+-transporting ATPase subunit G/H
MEEIIKTIKKAEEEAEEIVKAASLEAEKMLKEAQIEAEKIIQKSSLAAQKGVSLHREEEIKRVELAVALIRERAKKECSKLEEESRGSLDKAASFIMEKILNGA